MYMVLPLTVYSDNTTSVCTVLAEIWPVMDRCTVISKKEVFYLWPFGLATWLWGTIFIDRLNVEKAQNTVNSTGDIIRKNKVCMY
jgi:lysophosphatidate acyltransferase